MPDTPDTITIPRGLAERLYRSTTDHKAAWQLLRAMGEECRVCGGSRKRRVEWHGGWFEEPCECVKYREAQP